MKSCHGAAAVDQQKRPAAMKRAPALVMADVPRRRCQAGRQAPAIAPARKCTLTAAEMRATDHPVVFRMTLRNTGGPKNPIPQPKNASTKEAYTTLQPKN